jgi:TetR/AcrR family transcriptional regulator, transcriptional repressor for nem operon
MARPKEFDRDEALETAKGVFWRKGFNATSTDDLRLAMGIGRQSFYDTFGGKREVYLQALRKYMGDQLAGYVEKLKSARPGNAIRELLLSIANESPDARALGCLGILSTCEFGAADPEVKAVIGSAGVAIDALFERALKDAKESGEVRASLDERAGARFLRSTLTGMRVSARGGASPLALREIANVALEGLRAS